MAEESKTETKQQAKEEKEKPLSFSLLIPTRNRQHTAIAAVESAINCNDPLLQIVVSDNSDDDRLRDMIDERNWMRRVVYQKTERFLSMRDNWEFALDRAEGDYVTVIGDDDAVMPDCFVWARNILPRLDVEVLQGGYSIFKWHDYPFPGRRNYLQMRFNEEVLIYQDPKQILRRAINYNPRIGTGPGLYYGFVRRDYLNRIRKLRGRWIVDPIPDFDSGYATLMYARRYARAERCVFVSGHSKKSNSGSFRTAVSFRTSMRNMDPDNPTSDSVFLADELGLRANRAVIVQCQLRMMDEIRKALGDPDADIDRPAAWSYMAEEMSRGYESVSFPMALAALEALAERWNLKDKVKMPEKRMLSAGLTLEQGAKPPPPPPKKEGEENKRQEQLFDRLVINGNKLGFKSILDAIKFAESVQPPLQQSPSAKIAQSAAQVAGKTAQQRMARAQLYLRGGNPAAALDELNTILVENPHNVNALRMVSVAQVQLGRYDDAEASLSQALSVSPKDVALLTAYVDVLRRLEYEDFAQIIVEARLADDGENEELLALQSKLKSDAATRKASLQGV